MEKKSTRKQWHRLLGLILEPLFDRLGYETKIEYDLSRQQQFIDLIVVRKKESEKQTEKLPKSYWENFGQLNEHNLISFKSYSESFNGFSLAELLGHYISYLKANELKGSQVNLYVITNHFPRKLLSPFNQAGFVNVVQPEEVIELELPGIKTISFLLIRNTENPILSLFSDRKDKVVEAFTKLKEESSLLAGISDYIFEIINRYAKEVLKMYTREDFLREHPRDKRPLFFFPWDKENHLMDLERARRESRLEGELKGRLEGELNGRIEAKLKGELKLLNEMYKEGILSKEQFSKRAAPLQKKLEKFHSDR